MIVCPLEPGIMTAGIWVGRLDCPGGGYLLGLPLPRLTTGKGSQTRLHRRQLKTSLGHNVQTLYLYFLCRDRHLLGYIELKWISYVYLNLKSTSTKRHHGDGII